MFNFDVSKNKQKVSNFDFDQLLITNVDFLKPVAITLTRNPDNAEDLYQETLYKALANREKYNVSTNIKAWLYTIMRNIFINNYRRKVKQNISSDQSANDLLLNQFQGSDSYSLESIVQEKYIREAMNQLPQLFRQPLLLYFEGYKYHEIAELLKEPLGTIKSRIHFARKLLKEQVRRYK